MTDREANAELTWPESCSAVHAQLDSTASCSICNDFYDTPLVLPCGHSFCSNCIRSYISHQQGQARCPQCRAVCDERDLRPNTALRDLVDKLLQARPAYIAAIRSHKPGHSRLVKASQDKQGLNSAGPPSLDSGSNKRQLRSGKTLHDTGPVAEAAAVTTIDISEDSKVKESPRKRQRTAGNDGVANSSSGPSAAARVSSAPVSADVAACPICNRNFKAGRVLEAHVNRCIDNPPVINQELPAQQQQQQQPQRLAKKPQKGVPQVKVPAKIAFHLFNDKKLRDKLKDHNLPIHGKRKDLEERYNRLRLEVQLAADKAEAVSEAELVRRTMAKEKTIPPVKGFFGAAKGGLKGSGSGADAASDDPDLPDVEYDSFAALIQATKERDAARKAKQQKAQLADAPAPASVAINSITAPDAPNQLSDAHQDGNVGGLLSNGQNVRHPDANGLLENRHTSDGQTPIGDEEQLAEYPAGALSSGGSQPSDAVLPTRGKPPNSSRVMQRRPSQEPALQHEDSFTTSTGRPRLHVKAGKDQDLQSHDDKCEHLGCTHAGPHDATKLTLDDSSEGLSQSRLEVDLMDEAGPMSDPAAQDQRALQQLQLLNKSAVPAVTNGTSLAKAMVSSYGKGHVLPSSVVYHSSTDQTRNEEALGVLDDIIEDTDSDIEGMAA